MANETLKCKKKKKCTKKTSRPCLFCNKFFTDISKHLTTVHKNKPEIKEILNFSDSERIKALKVLRLKGISKANDLKLKNGEELICMKAQKSESRKVKCLDCNGIFNQKYIHIHKRSCTVVEKHVTDAYIPVDDLSCEDLKIFEESQYTSEEFNTRILDKLRHDDIGEIIRSEPLIQIIGNIEFEKIRGKKTGNQMRNRVFCHMRKIATLYSHIKTYLEKLKRPQISLAEMFCVENYPILKTTIQKLHDEGPPIKSGTVKFYDFFVKRASKALITYYQENNRDEEFNKTVNFLNYISENALCEFRRLPRVKHVDDKSVCLSTEIISLKSFIFKEINDLLNTITLWDKNNFIRLRSILVCLLTFCNDCSPIDITNITIDKWLTAKDGEFITEEEFLALNKEQQNLPQINHSRILTSSGNTREISVLIPKSCFKLLDILADTAVRMQAEILPDNRFLFPLTNQSKEAVSGYYDIKRVCHKAKLKRKLSANKMRPIISAEFKIFYDEEDLFTVDYPKNHSDDDYKLKSLMCNDISRTNGNLDEFNNSAHEFDFNVQKSITENCEINKRKNSSNPISKTKKLKTKHNIPNDSENNGESTDCAKRNLPDIIHSDKDGTDGKVVETFIKHEKHTNESLNCVPVLGKTSSDFHIKNNDDIPIKTEEALQGDKGSVQYEILPKGKRSTEDSSTKDKESPLSYVDTAGNIARTQIEDLENSSQDAYNIIQNNAHDESNSGILEKKKRPRKKTSRPCLYCGKFYADITKHLLTVHKTETEVTEISMMTGYERIKALKNLRLKGISKANDLKLQCGETPICIRAQRVESRKVMCVHCKGIFAHKYFYHHRKTCEFNEKCIKGASSLSVEYLCDKNPTSSKDTHPLDEDFKEKILNELKQDDIDTIVKAEPLIQIIGNEEYEKVKGENSESETSRHVLSHMREVAALYSHINDTLKTQQKSEISFDQLFHYENYQILEKAIQILSNGSDFTHFLCS